MRYMESHLNTKDSDCVFPGENFFFYWKTSASLWEEKLRDGHHGDIVLVPINWSFHSQNGIDYDFGENTPETDIKKISEIAASMAKEAIFLIPLSPVPYLPNGGLPAVLSRTLSLSEEGYANAFLDQEDKIHKFYSFYDPRIYQSYQKFVWKFGEYLTTHGVDNDVVGFEAGFVDNGKYISYLEDYSTAFEKGFAKFMEVKRKERVEELELSENSLSIEQEKKFKREYLNIIRDLYSKTAQECSSGNWSGSARYSFVGGKPRDIFYRGTSTLGTSVHYFQVLMDSLTLDVIPCSVLLGSNIKRGSLERLTGDLINKAYISAKFRNEIYEDGLNFTYKPLTFFEVFEFDHCLEKPFDKWGSLGLFAFFDTQYKWTYCLRMNLNELHPDEDLSERTLFFSGDSLSADRLKEVLKFFMNGARIFLNTDGLAENLKKRIETFFLENSLEVQKVNFLTDIQAATLGDGELILFHGGALKEAPIPKQISFWENLNQKVQQTHLKVDEETGVNFYWRTRSPKATELNYQEVRRLSFYNPSSYRKKVHIPSRKNFAFLKALDEVNSKYNSGPTGIELELLPGGSLSLDFGFYL